MAVTELKNQIKDRIDAVNEEHLLEEILNLLEFESEDNEIFIIPVEHEKEIEKSLEQFENGEIITNESVLQNFQAWLLKNSGQKMHRFI